MKLRGKPLPPLEADQIYQAPDLAAFDYLGSALTGSEALLGLRLANRAVIDLPISSDELKRLMRVLCDAFPQDALEHLHSRPWYRDKGS